MRLLSLDAGSSSTVMMNIVVLFSLLFYNVDSFGLSPSSPLSWRVGKSITPSSRHSTGWTFVDKPCVHHTTKVRLFSKEAADDDNNEEKDEDESYQNPYQDPNYPDLEFIDYSDPNYSVDQGVTDEFFSSPSSSSISTVDDDDDTDTRIEEMREERRRRNDEYQFETYHRDILCSGNEFFGEWTVYRTTTFLNGVEEEKKKQQNVDLTMPKLLKSRSILRVKSSGNKITVPTSSTFRVDGERLIHREQLIVRDYDSNDNNDDDEDAQKTQEENEEEDFDRNTYWPPEMSSFDFRGQQGNMCVGNAYTICHSIPLYSSNAQVKKDKAKLEDWNDTVANREKQHDGPFAELRKEVGILANDMRFRVKFDYRVKGSDKTTTTIATTTPSSAPPPPPPPLHLHSMTVCRETRESWPRGGDPSQTVTSILASEALFGPPGARGGLYDPPPVGSEEQASRYMLLDLDGGATVLFPYMMDQDPNAFNGNGWVTSLDWTPGRMRYQVDRKVHGGIKLKGLRTLELSEVQRVDADKYRPKDGGMDMRQ